MFLKKRHLEILREMKKTDVQEEIRKKLPEDFKSRILELFILGFVELEDGKITFTDAGKKLMEIVDKLNIEELPDVFVDTEIIKILQLSEETNYIPENWKVLLKERQMLDENENLNEIGKEILKIFTETHPVLYLTKEIIDFINKIPKISTLEDLITHKNTVEYGDNIVNALQAMRMLYISPRTERGQAYTTTKTADLALKILSYVKVFNRPLILKGSDIELLKSGGTSKELDEMGFHDEKGVTELGNAMIDTYESMGIVEEKTLPIYVLDDEIKVLEGLLKLEEINKHTPDILPTYSEIQRRVDVEDLGEILHTLESKELIERKFMKNKDTYWVTNWGRTIVELGVVTTEGMKAITYSLSGDVPIAEWVLAGKEEGLIKKGVTQKGHTMIKFSKSIKRKPYLTKYDIAILLKVPKGKYIHKDEVIKLVQDLVGGDEKAIIKAIGEAESKGFIVELQNKIIKLTDLGTDVKTAIEYAKIDELLSTKFGITPTTFNILKVIYNNLDKFNKIWKESREERGYKEDEIKLIKKNLSLSEEEIHKALVILRALGFLGKKSITKAGEILVKAYEKLYA
ncbi:conserved protein of unknown function [Methanocaldococcus lauensis]|uniref:DUF505 domain-containing protein n=1 Tax=Methanocaldococcus lauensis TaxID=2546128 RepID=A0A8D6PQT0_9EURY|nr:DUF505 family protein [Methanocaldococcus lauensis]CAB3288113.1 conserved protein of unknown function [Methanocaldococcus lauensis]